MNRNKIVLALLGIIQSAIGLALSSVALSSFASICKILFLDLTASHKSGFSGLGVAFGIFMLFPAGIYLLLTVTVVLTGCAFATGRPWTRPINLWVILPLLFLASSFHLVYKELEILTAWLPGGHTNSFSSLFVNALFFFSIVTWLVLVGNKELCSPIESRKNTAGKKSNRKFLNFVVVLLGVATLLYVTFIFLCRAMHF